jgi:hypothetical protein
MQDFDFDGFYDAEEMLDDGFDHPERDEDLLDDGFVPIEDLDRE